LREKINGALLLKFRIEYHEAAQHVDCEKIVALVGHAAALTGKYLSIVASLGVAFIDAATVGVAEGVLWRADEGEDSRKPQ